MRRFLSDKSGTTMEGLALIAAVAALLSIASADMLQRLGNSGKLEQFAFFRNNGYSAPARTPERAAGAAESGVDYDATATVVRRYTIQKSILDAPEKH